jgi:DnaJ-class molecular chaperone
VTVLRCPVCDGRGVVTKGFYNPWPFFTGIDTTPDKCRTCEGSGVVEVGRCDDSPTTVRVRPA